MQRKVPVGHEDVPCSVYCFISNPEQVVPGNNMKPYSGLVSAEERAKIITFLEANEGS